MTQKGLYHQPTENLVQRTKTKFYPLDIPVPHPQLRNFISAVDREWIYYASGHDIFTFHLPTKKTSLLITIPFGPRCLAAGLGWICLGGENNGDCAFIELNDRDSDTRFQVDAALPADVSGNPDRAAPEDNAGRTLTPFSWHPDLLTQELGGDIVNSITIHELSNKGLSDWNTPVALLSNNDKTVKIWSLLQRKVVAELLHPFPMNYAMISPDSEVLVAVGDGSRGFFYRRKATKESASATSTDLPTRFPKYEWQLFAIPRLPIGDHIHDDHSFAITFSPSGHLSALSSQGGMISVFDMNVLNNLSDDDECEKARVCMFKSSRTALWGCIRSMSFSPEPWDLLAWTEDHGRVGIADVRQAFYRRQIIELDPTSAQTIELDDVTPYEIQSLDLRGRLIHQYRERMQSEYGRLPNQADYGLTRGELQNRQNSRAEVDLDARERSVLDTLELTMEELYEASLPARQHPYSLNYTSSPRVRASLESEASSTANSENAAAETSRDQVSDIVREQREQRERVRNIERSYLPRRRSSVVLSPQSSLNISPQAMSRIARITASPSRLSQTDDQDTEDLPPLISTNDLTPTADDSSTQSLPYSIPPSDPWHVIQATLESARATDAASVPSHVSIARLEAALAAQRRLSLTASSNVPTQSTSTSAQTSTLPTTNLPASRDPPRTPDEIRARWRHHDRLSTAEQEQERALRRLSAARALAAEGNDPTTRNQARAEVERHQRLLEARVQARQRVAAATAAASAAASNGDSESVSGRTRLERAVRLAREAGTESSGRSRTTVTDSDMRLARMMMLGTARQPTDRNGNWVAGEALERLVWGRGNANIDPDGLGGSARSEAMREMGVGTAGVAWSHDGSVLYVGTEEGIFEYTINLTDRKTFPTISFR